MADAKLVRLKVLEGKKETLFQRMQLIYNESKKIDNPVNLKNFQIRLKTIEATRSEFETNMEELNELNLAIDPAAVVDFAALDSMDELYCHIQVAVDSITKPPVASKTVSKTPAKTRLPKIELPTFSGDLNEWPIFYQSFKALIHENEELTAMDKIYYLTGKLVGTAKNICSGLPPTGDNYSIIWDTLVKRYEDERRLANSYLRKILDFKPLFSESATGLDLFINSFHSSVSAFKQLKIDDKFDYILMYLALSKLDSATCKAFEMHRSESNIPTYDEVVEFVQAQTKVLNSSLGLEGPRKTKTPSDGYTKYKAPHQTFMVSKDALDTKKCCACGKGAKHTLNRCPKFLELSSYDRYELVRKSYLCLNCFSNHRIANCQSKFNCSICQQRHNTLLHFEEAPISRVETSKLGLGIAKNRSVVEAVRDDPQPSTSFCAKATKLSTNFEVLVSTVVVRIMDKHQVPHNVRLMLDSCSQANFLSVNCCKRLKLPIENSPTMVSGLGLTQNKVLGRTKAFIHSRFLPNVSYDLEFLVMEQVAHPLPNSKLDPSVLGYLNNLPLADSNFHRPGEIDGILNAHVYANIMGSNKISGPPGCPLALETKFGYVIVGEARILPSFSLDTQRTYCALTEPSIEHMLRKFWEVEEVKCITPILSDEDRLAEKIFAETCTRSLEGRYTVALPFKEDPSALGNSYGTAHKRFLSLERKLQSSLEFRNKYNEGMMDYITQNHISRVLDNEIQIPGYYIPHHGVWKMDSATTQLRIVFDASCKTSSSKSLNDLLCVGPKLQTDILEMLLKFRLFPVAMVSDVRQMYRQIQIVDEHKRYQRLLYRFKPEDPISVFQINTVAFGVSSSPYLALRTLHQLANDENQNYPNAAPALRKDMYVDDFVTSVNCSAEAIKLYKEMVDILASGGFDMLKWSTNCTQLLEQIPIARRSPKAVEFDETTLKVLGLQWDSQTDQFSFKVASFSNECTKRRILSTIARIFDPLGLASPVILLAKMLMKELWLLRIDWDETPPARVCSVWKNFVVELPLLENLLIPRHLGVVRNSKISLIGFSDASEKAYGAVIYVRTLECNGSFKVSLLCSKSKVAPLKIVSIPRLELCAAHVLAKLLDIVIKIYSPLVSNEIMVVALTDSTTTLSWITSSPHLWKTFVANRTAKIQELAPTARWFHVAGEENPADKVSRGVSTNLLIQDELWLHGPTWLKLELDKWPIKSSVQYTQLEQRVVSCVATSSKTDPFLSLIERHSNFLKLVHSVVYVLRFCKRLPFRRNFTGEDLAYAERVLVRSVQHLHFRNSIQALKEGKPPSSELQKLKPFLDGDLLRVGGRLSNAQLSLEQKHPLVLPKSDHFVNLLIEHYHRKNLHTGPTLVLALLRQRFWILAARSIVRKQIRGCNLCFRNKPKPTFPAMADLPAFRVQEAKPFVHTGTDFAGPLQITISRRRGAKTQKAYICLFICLVTKALHLELVSDLSTANFLQGFKRFISRRGPCSCIYSDNGTNFIGAKTVLKDLYELVTSEEYIDSFHNEFAQRRIDWKFNPPSAPHFGGSWESQVKCVKTHLYKVIGNQILTYEELNTVLVQIEALLNSRPLCGYSDDDSDAPIALTPAHFLTLTPLQFLPAPDVRAVPLNRLDRYQLIDQIVQHFWQRWHLEYLNTLQVRYRWNKESPPLQAGMIVVVKEDKSQPLQWPLGVIKEVFPGKDGVVRVVSVRTRQGLFKRPVVKLCPLPSQ